MYFVSRFGGHGRGIWARIDNGTVHIREKGNGRKIQVKGGIVASETSWTKNTCTTLRYGQDLTVKKNKKIVYQEFYQLDTLRGKQKGGLWKRQSGMTLCGAKGTLECYSTSNGACGKEVFTYRNKVTAYIAAHWRKKLTVYRPSGKLWMVIQGKNHVSRTPIVEQLEKKNSSFELWRFMDGNDWQLSIYDADGTTVVTQGSYKNRQKEGKWLEDGKVCYYMAGIKVSAALYQDDPNLWNPREVLTVPNAQLRCSLLGRLGYDRLLAKVKSKILDCSPDGGQLIEIKAESSKAAGSLLDQTMRLIKVICPSTGQSYILRVPPQMNQFEQARQWTFGLRQDNIRNGELLEFIKET